MKIFRHLNEIEFDPNTVLTIGTFDGIHLGHQEILRKLFERSKFHKARNLLITFHPHPRKVISKANGLKLLSTPDEKISILKELGLDNLFIINFTADFSQQLPLDFIKNYIINKIGLKEIVIGHDHKFGKGREGTSETLKALGVDFKFDITVVNEFKFNGDVVSSTKIRNALIEGDILKANSLLGRNYSFTGTVIEGDKRGRLLGYPTANVKLEDNDKLLPGLGIYACYVIIENQRAEGLLSIGKRPTFYDNGETVTEVYIYNFNRNIYHQKINIMMVDKIRQEEKFSSPEDLINQMNKDKEAGEKIFARINKLETQNFN
ncbi:MAG: bifunctional riboflavin kinase/FAD synthetase [Ignavibacteriaceae bacterium]|nr:bifunctional riboflavin kinase/FAD synthetase [Ignavibacteriaceae bacterium]